MLPSAHFFSGVAVFAVISILNIIPRSFQCFTLIVVCSVIPDFDIFMCSLHRNKLTHTPIFWSCISVVIVAINRSMWIIILPFLLHFLLDSLDYGIMVVYPFSRKKYGLAILGGNSATESRSLFSYLTDYLSNRKLVSIEVEIALTSLFLLFIVPFLLRLL
jgi:hypothetical protein